MKKPKAYTFARDLRKRQTIAEEVFWAKVRGKKIGGYKIIRQYVVEHSNNLGKSGHFIVDFYCSKKRLLIEIDGGIHLKQIAYDNWRTGILKEMGFSMIRFTNEAVLTQWEIVEEKLLARLNILDSRY